MSHELNLEQIRAVAEKGIPFVMRSGLIVISANRGYAQCKMPLKGNENHMQSMYAGAQFTLADITGGALALASFDSKRFYPTLKDLQMKFVKPAQSDLVCSMSINAAELAQLIIDADTQGKAAFILQGELRDVRGDVVAMASGEFHVRAKR